MLGGAVAAEARTAPKQLPVPAPEKAAADVAKAPAAAAKEQAAAAPQAAPKAKPASPASAPVVAQPKADAAAGKTALAATPPPVAKAVLPSGATLASHAAPGRSTAAPSALVPTAAEKRSAARTSVALLPDELPSLAGKRDKGMAPLSTKPSTQETKPASVGDKRPRQEAVDEVTAKRAAVRACLFAPWFFFKHCC